MNTSERERIRRWRRHIYMRIQFVIGLILLAYTWLTLLPALWWSNIGRNAAAGLTLWFAFTQVYTVMLLWRWLSPYWWRRETKECA